MIRTTITTSTADISIHLPQNYIGKKLELLVYSVDELTEDVSTDTIVDNSTFRGALHLTDDQYLDFQHHTANLRDEWNRGI